MNRAAVMAARDHAPELLERLEVMQSYLIGDRDCFYEGCAVGNEGQITDADDQHVLDSMDKDIELNAAIIKKAKGIA